MQDVIIVGGGIVGLATALKLLEQRPNLKVQVIEKEKGPAKHQTGNNSGVIHSGVYYKPGSLKATNCKRGYDMLLEFCETHAIPYDLCGKIIVATEEWEKPILQGIYDRGVENGLDGLTWLDKEGILEVEPHVTGGIKAIRVPQAGIVNYKRVSEKYVELIEAAGGTLTFGQKVIGLDERKGSSIVKTTGGDFETKLVVNCGGLYSDRLAKMSEQSINMKIVPFRGEYYELTEDAEHLVKGLIYPVPDPAFPFLGVHFTRMIEGGVEAGPNAVLAFAREGYKKSIINLPELFESLTYSGFIKIALRHWKQGSYEMYRSFSKRAFVNALQKLIPEIESKQLKRGGAGVRAQAVQPDGSMVDDFLILENKHAINVCNAPSPAATSSLAIGETVSGIALKHLA